MKIQTPITQNDSPQIYKTRTKQKPIKGDANLLQPINKKQTKHSKQSTQTRKQQLNKTTPETNKPTNQQYKEAPQNNNNFITKAKISQHY